MDAFNAALLDFLAGQNGGPADTEDGEEHDEMEIPSPQREIIANIDNEMALARDMLNKLTQRRNEVHRVLLLKNAPSLEEKRALMELIAEKEKQLKRLQLEVIGTRTELDRLLSWKAPDIIMIKDSAYNQEDTSHEYHSGSKHGDTVDNEVRLYQARLDNLLSNQKALESGLEAHWAILSPIRKLPLEILSSIFLQSLPDDDFTRPSLATSPVVLTNICSSWRDVALNTPELWSSISINVRNGTYSPCISLIQCWVQRSGIASLSFRVTEEWNRGQVLTSFSALPVVLDIFIPHYNRWRKVHLTYGKPCLAKTGLSVLPPDAEYPKLESLHLQSRYWMEQKDMERITAIVLSAPSLRSIFWLLPCTFPAFPWAQLTHFSISRLIPMSEAFRMLAECPVLQGAVLTLMLTQPVSQSFDGISSDSVIHNALQSLTVHAIGDIKLLLDRLQLPRLSHLSLEKTTGPIPTHFVEDVDWSHEAFASFISRSRCTLDFLSLGEFDMSPEDLIGCLRHCSTTLKELHLNNERPRELYVGDQVLKLMTYWPVLSDTWTTGMEEGQEALCPHINTLKLWGCISSTDGLLAQMLYSRWRSRPKDWTVRQLQVVLIGLFENPPHPLDEEGIRSMDETRSGITLIKLRS